VLLSWEWAQVRLTGTVRYIVYTSESLDVPFGSWSEVNEHEDILKAEISVTRGLTRDSGEWHEATLFGLGKGPIRFFRVKAVRVSN